MKPAKLIPRRAKSQSRAADTLVGSHKGYIHVLVAPRKTSLSSSPYGLGAPLRAYLVCTVFEPCVWDTIYGPLFIQNV